MDLVMLHKERLVGTSHST